MSPVRIRVTNRHASHDIYVFSFNPGDVRWPLVVRDPSRDPNLAWAARELFLIHGTSGTLTHPDRACFVGVKKTDRTSHYVDPPNLQLHTTGDEFEYTAAGEWRWVNRPLIPDPTPPPKPADLATPLPSAAGWVVGVGRALVIDPAVVDSRSRLPLQGWAATSQVSAGLESQLYARAFIIGDPATGRRVTMVVADIWSCSIAVKQAVIERLNTGIEGGPYRADNVWIAGTHTHSAPGGYLHHFLYNATGFGFDGHVFECVVRGIMRAIELAHRDLAPGAVLIGEADLVGLTRNRSQIAFERNSQSDQRAFPRGVNERMTLLKFVHRDGPPGTPEVGIGALNWFAIHPTNRGSDTRAVNGDNKGWAAQQFERVGSAGTRPGFVAAFANNECGDVSGNFLPGAGGFDPPISLDQRFVDRMMAAGEQQATLADAIYTAASVELSGEIGYQHQVLDFEHRTGLPGALGLSMPAGSVEDGGAGLMPEGITLGDPNDPLSILGAAPSVVAAGVGGFLTSLVRIVSSVINANSLAGFLRSLSATPDPAHAALQWPKPILLETGAIDPVPLTPNVVPIQLMRFGSFAVLGVPGEVTTVAGRRIMLAAKKELSRREVNRIVIGAYANGYSGYVTTEEEYAAQQYEGASTLFGPQTCSVYEKAYGELGKAEVDGKRLVDDAPLPDLSRQVWVKPRMTFRNLWATTVRFRLYTATDRVYALTLWPGADFSVKSGQEVAVTIPFPASLGLTHVQVVIGRGRPGATRSRVAFAQVTDLIAVLPDGRLVAGDYVPGVR